MIDKNRYYGIAYNYSEDIYRRTGLLANVSNYKDVENIMFIHNSIEKESDEIFKMVKMYYRETNTETEHILEISDLPLSKFELCPIGLALNVLFHIDYGIYKSYPQSDPPAEIAESMKAFDDYLEQEKKEKEESLDNEKKITEEKCTFCSGTGKVSGITFREATCPICNGTGRKKR